MRCQTTRQRKTRTKEQKKTEPDTDEQRTKEQSAEKTQKRSGKLGRILHEVRVSIHPNDEDVTIIAERTKPQALVVRSRKSTATLGRKGRLDEYFGTASAG